MSHVATLFRPTFVNAATGKVMPNDTGWQDRHVAALKRPIGFEHAIVQALEAWARYADTHRARYDSKLDDYVIGDAWERWGRAIHDLLNGETGRLDCGTLSAFIHDTLESEGHREGT